MLAERYRRHVDGENRAVGQQGESLLGEDVVLPRRGELGHREVINLQVVAIERGGLRGDSQVEFEPQCEGRAAVRLHVGWHGLWEAERHRRGYLPDD